MLFMGRDRERHLQTVLSSPKTASQVSWPFAELRSCHSRFREREIKLGVRLGWRAEGLKRATVTSPSFVVTVPGMLNRSGDFGSLDLRVSK